MLTGLRVPLLAAHDAKAQNLAEPLFNPGFIISCQETFDRAVSDTKGMGEAISKELIKPILDLAKTLYIDREFTVFAQKSDLHNLEALYKQLTALKKTYQEEYAKTVGYTAGSRITDAINKFDESIRQMIQFATDGKRPPATPQHATAAPSVIPDKKTEHDALFNQCVIASMKMVFLKHNFIARGLSQHMKNELLNPILDYMSHIYIDDARELTGDASHDVMGLLLLISRQKDLYKERYQPSLGFMAAKDMRAAFTELEDRTRQFVRYSLGTRADTLINNVIAQEQAKFKESRLQQVWNALVCVSCCCWCLPQYFLTFCNCCGLGREACTDKCDNGEATWCNKEVGTPNQDATNCGGCGCFICKCCAPVTTINAILADNTASTAIAELTAGPARLRML